MAYTGLQIEAQAMRLIPFLIILTLMPSPSYAEPDVIPFGMALGERLSVRLPSNPSTGYDWEIVRMPAFLEHIGEREFASDAKVSGMVGAGGVAIWRFEVIGSGVGSLGFAYSRPWETAPPIESVEYWLTAAP